jgi:hypothetical protein
MNARVHKLNTKSSEQALAAFVSKKAEIDAMLARPHALSEDHFGYAPNEVTWAHVGTLEHYAELLKRMTDQAFHEGDRRNREAERRRSARATAPP